MDHLIGTKDKNFSLYIILCIAIIKIAGTSSTLHNSNYQYQDLEIEKYIPSTIKPTCTVVIISEDLIEFRPMPNRPVMLLTGKQGKLIPRDYCNILVVPNLNPVQNFITDFMLENRINTEVILVYSYPDRPLTIKQVRTFFRELDVVLIDVAQSTSILYQYPIRCGHSLACKMRNRLLRVGYTSIPPSFAMPGWEERAEQKLPIEPFIVDRTNRVHKYFTGPEAMLLGLLVDTYQMRFEMKAPQDFDYGQKTFPNGSYYGKFGLLERGEVDMVIGSIAMNRERSKLGSYSPHIASIKFSLVSRNDERVQTWDAALRPFPKLAWCILGLSIVFVAPVTWFVTKKHRQFMNIRNIKNESLAMYFAHATATLLVEPWPRPPGGPAAIILSAWFIACLVLQSIYASNFAASLSFPDKELPIESLQDCLDKKRPLITSPGNSVDWYLKHSNDPVIQAVYKRRIVLDTPHDAHLFEHLDKGFIVTMPTRNFYSRMAKEGIPPEGKYHVAEKPILTTFGTWMFKEDDVNMAREIAMVIMRCSEAGLLTKWENDMKRKLRMKFQKMSSHAESIHLALTQKNMALSMEHLEGVFKFWVFGILLGILTFTYEITYHPTYNACTGAVRRARIRKELAKYTFLD